MHNQRNRLSADMKGTVAVETATKGKDGREDVVSLQEGKQNDIPKLDATNIENTDENTDEVRQEHSESYRKDMNSHRSVIVGDQEKLQLDWRVSEWSRCSQTCGEDGRQVKNQYIITKLLGSNILAMIISM